MARKPRFGQRNNWRFADAGTRFDGRSKPRRRSSGKPISPALKRGVIHCARCGSRVVSNVDYCPFCGRSLRPFYGRFWFWLLVVIVVAISVVWIIRVNLPQENTTPSGPVTPELPQVIGGDANSSLKNLALGTSIDNSGLEVTVESITLGPLAANGSQIYVVEVRFYNNRSEAVTLLATQWLLETTEGARLDTFVGSTEDGTTLISNLETSELPAQGRFNGRLYFAIASPPASEEDLAAGLGPYAISPRVVIYQPSALVYSEDLLVTWELIVTFEEPGE